MGRMHRPVVAFAFAFVALTLAAGPVLADTELGHVGLVGDHRVFDGTTNEFFSGIVCFYDSTRGNRLHRLTVMAPDVYARNVTGAIDSQRVGWRVLVKRQRPGSTTLKPFYRSPTQRAIATDASPAEFPRPGGPGVPPYMSIDLDVPNEPGMGSQYFISIRMFWYRAGALEGTATHQLDYYLWVIFPPGDDGWWDPSCYTRKAP